MVRILSSGRNTRARRVEDDENDGMGEVGEWLAGPFLGYYSSPCPRYSPSFSFSFDFYFSGQRRNTRFTKYLSVRDSNFAYD